MDKYVPIFLIALVVSLFSGLAFSQYQQQKCIKMLVDAGKSSDDIVKICKL
jgi:hypothetical protein